MFKGEFELQKEIIQKSNIFENSSEVLLAGWAKNNLLSFNSESYKYASKICQSDCYFISNNEVSLYISIENLGFEFKILIAVADLKRGGELSDCVVKKFLLNKPEFPKEERNGEFFYSDKRIQLQITNTNDGKLLKCDFIDFSSIKNLYFNINLKRTDFDYLNVIAPFERDRKYFYYKQFAPVYYASGKLSIGGMEYKMDNSSTLAYFDRIKFHKPRKHNYQRLTCDTIIQGHRISLCLASRVGDNRFGNENSLFCDGKLYKLHNIDVSGPSKGRLERPWYFKGGITAVDLSFRPFTLKTRAMAPVMDNTTIIFGKIFGEIKRVDIEQPLVLDNAKAHIVLSQF